MYNMYYILCFIPRKATLKDLALFTILPEAVSLKGFVVYVLLVLVSNMIASYTCSCLPRKFCKYNLIWESSFSFDTVLSWPSPKAEIVILT